MRIKLIIAFLLFSTLSFGQTVTHTPCKVFNPKRELVTVLTPLDFKIEIGGHVYDNKKSKDPIKFKATLKGIKIYDSKKEYHYMECDLYDCNTIHLVESLNNDRVEYDAYLDRPQGLWELPHASTLQNRIK